MSIKDKKITSWTSPVVNESDRPQRTASEMKAVFDSNSNQLRAALNGLIDELSENGAGELGAESVEGIDGATVQEQLESLNDKKLNKDGDSSENTVTFAEAAIYAAPASGDTHATLFGKILKRFNLLGALANKNTVSVTDINNGAVTNAKQAAMAAGTIKGNAGNTSAAPADLSVSDVKGMLGLRTDGGVDQFLNASGNYSGVPFAGNGLPIGGRIGQKLVKSVEEDYEAGWVDDFIVETAMSDTSENLVQNKVIKKYVDKAVADAATGDIIVPTGMLKGNSDGSIAQAVAGTDYQVPLRAGTGISISGNIISLDLDNYDGGAF